MMETLKAYKFYVKPGKTDLRKRATSLSFIVQYDMKLVPFEKSVFVFCKGSHSTIRAIVWDRNGWFEISKSVNVKEVFHCVFSHASSSQYLFQ
jgi:transposase